MVFDWFGVIIFLIVFLLLFCVVKVYLDSNVVKKKGNDNYALLIKKYNAERDINQINTQKTKLIVDFNNSVIGRLLHITKELISLQKFIFE